MDHNEDIELSALELALWERELNDAFHPEEDPGADGEPQATAWQRASRRADGAGIAGEDASVTALERALWEHDLNDAVYVEDDEDDALGSEPAAAPAAGRGRLIRLHLPPRHPAAGAVSSMWPTAGLPGRLTA